jgi:hypothetical protein
MINTPSRNRDIVLQIDTIDTELCSQDDGIQRWMRGSNGICVYCQYGNYAYRAWTKSPSPSLTWYKSEETKVK